jgi:hypothetical protein
VARLQRTHILSPCQQIVDSYERALMSAFADAARIEIGERQALTLLGSVIDGRAAILAKEPSGRGIEPLWDEAWRRLLLRHPAAFGPRRTRLSKRPDGLSLAVLWTLTRQSEALPRIRLSAQGGFAGDADLATVLSRTNWLAKWSVLSFGDAAFHLARDYRWPASPLWAYFEWADCSGLGLTSQPATRDICMVEHSGSATPTFCSALITHELVHLALGADFDAPIVESLLETSVDEACVTLLEVAGELGDATGWITREQFQARLREQDHYRRQVMALLRLVPYQTGPALWRATAELGRANLRAGSDAERLTLLNHTFARRWTLNQWRTYFGDPYLDTTPIGPPQFCEASA